MGFWQKSLRYMQSVLGAAVNPQLHSLCVGALNQGLIVVRNGVCLESKNK